MLHEHTRTYAERLKAFLADAPIIVLDEATANIDTENEKELTEAIENLTKEKTIIMIAHRLKTIRHTDQIIVIDKGKIVQQGSHEKLMAEDGIYFRQKTGSRLEDSINYIRQEQSCK